MATTEVEAPRRPVVKAEQVADYARIAPILARLRRDKEPNFSIRYRVGVVLSKELEPCCSFEEIADQFGITTHNAYTLTVTALGALACQLYLRLNSPDA